MNLRVLLTLFGFSVFIIGVSYALYSFWKMRFGRLKARVNKRLHSIASSNKIEPTLLSDLTQYSSIPYLNSLLPRYSLARYVREALLKLKWPLRCDQFLLFALLLVIFFDLLLNKLGSSFLLSLLFALIVASIPFIYMRVELNKRQVKLETQLPEILDFISRAMQAGHTFIGSLQLAANDAREPIASEFQRTFQEINFGRSVQHAMADLSNRIDCPEMRYFAVAVFINQEIGGNLASLISGVSTLIRERIKTKMTLHAMTSEARSSAWILSILPFAVALLMFFVRPDFIGVLWKEPSGRSMVGYTMVLLFVGILWMQRMAKIRA